MITFSDLGKKGNLGNQLFQIASTVGIAKNNNHEFCFPEWKNFNYFKFNFNKCTFENNWEIVKEKHFEFNNFELENKNYDLNGWLQTEKYFHEANIKDLFAFKAEFENDLIEKHKILFTKETILITVRRGDFVNNPNYFQLSYKYYLTALLENFNSIEHYNIIFTSDSISYCKKHFSFLPNVYFLENLTPIEQICLGSKCDNYIISNSTFSWWLAWLGENNTGKIIRPVRIFDGEYSKKYNESDYFPSRWIEHNADDFKVPNKFIKLKIYGNLYQFNERIIYLKKKYIKFFKNKIKQTINYK